jgi:hypothetical protein
MLKGNEIINMEMVIAKWQGWENGKFTIVGDVSVRVLTPCLKRRKGWMN